MNKEAFPEKETKEEIFEPKIESIKEDISTEAIVINNTENPVWPDTHKDSQHEPVEKLYIPTPDISVHPDSEKGEIPKKIESNKNNQSFLKKLLQNAAKGALFSGLLATSTAKAAPTTPEQVLKNTDSTESIQKKTPEAAIDDKLDLAKTINEIKEKSPNIAKVVALEQKDSTKEVFAIALNSYKSYEDIFEVLGATGLTPSSEETMVASLKNNPTLLNKGFSFMATKEEVNKLGKPSYATLTTKRGGGELFINARETDVPIDSDLDGYMFIVEKKKDNKNTIANYTDYVKN